MMYLDRKENKNKKEKKTEKRRSPLRRAFRERTTTKERIYSFSTRSDRRLILDPTNMESSHEYGGREGGREE
jgi:hypothetical protein